MPKLEDLEQINYLIKVLERCTEAYEELDSSLEASMVEADMDAHPALQEDYGGHLSRHSDGSGRWVDLRGCYVGQEVMRSTLQILGNKITTVLEALSDYDIDTSDYKDIRK